MPGLKYALRSFWAMIIFCTGGGLVLFGIAMADYLRSPIPLAATAFGIGVTYIGYVAEKRADNQYLLDRSLFGK